jgi:hypothetical protein
MDDLMNGVHAGQTIWTESHDIAEPRGRRIDFALFNGQVHYAGGETGSYAGVDVIDVVDGKEVFSANTTVLLSDGSVSVQTFVSETKFREGPGRIGGDGTWRIDSGTGRFAGLRGRGGTFEWWVDGDRYRAEFRG